MHPVCLSRLVAPSIAVCFAISGCADDKSAGPETNSEASSSRGGATQDLPPTKSEPETSPSTEPTPESKAAEPAEEAVTITIREEADQIEPLGDTVEVDKGQQIRLLVDSDAADELHVHSEPEQTFAVKAEQGQEFRFTIESPGTYEVESHELGLVVVKLQVS